jgi:hypothetical protein
MVLHDFLCGRVGRRRILLKARDSIRVAGFFYAFFYAFFMSW